LPLRAAAVRLLSFVLAASVVAWVDFSVRGERESQFLNSIATKIISGERISEETISILSTLVDEVADAGCRSRELIDAAIIQVYVAARSRIANGPHAGDDLQKARAITRAALACSPARPFLWYELFWIEKTSGAPSAVYLPLLERSYRFGPNEIWLSFYRSSDAIPEYKELGADTQVLIRNEFVRLLRDFPRVAAQVVAEVDEASRARALSWIADMPFERRRALATALDAMGAVVDVPGIDYLRGRVVDPVR
jgi:hypothetical protein